MPNQFNKAVEKFAKALKDGTDCESPWAYEVPEV
jgi:hypothetical protein